MSGCVLLMTALSGPSHYRPAFYGEIILCLAWCAGASLSVASLGLTNCQHSGETKVSNNRREQQSFSPLLAMWFIGNTDQRLTTMYFILWWLLVWWHSSLSLSLSHLHCVVVAGLASMVCPPPAEVVDCRPDQTSSWGRPGGASRQGTNYGQVGWTDLGSLGGRQPALGQPQILRSHMMTLQSSSSTEAKQQK